jgi:uncharacterized protein YcfJ
MKNRVLLVAVATAAMLLSACAKAEGVKSVTHATVDTASCQLVNKEDTTGKTVVGGGVGAVGGAIVGKMLFGKGAGGLLGGIAGGLAGGAVGNSMGKETWGCNLLVSFNGSTQMLTASADHQIRGGEQIKIVELASGEFRVM